MAANSKSLADDEGTFSDWIELHNPDSSPVSLAGWFLTDAAGNRTKWELPAVTLAPGGYMVVFASNKNRRDPNAPLHTNFALSAGGEYLGLIKPDGSVSFDYAPEFPAQSDDVSYGLAASTTGARGDAGFLRQPTPGAANTAAAAEKIQETVSFSRASGPFRNLISLQLSGAAPGQRIRYVMASSNAAAIEPTATSTEYTGPITISTSTLVRAAVFAADGSSHGAVASVHYAKLGASLGAFSSQLPVLVIDSVGSGPMVKDGVDHPSWMYLYASQGTSPTFGATPELISPLSTTVRGASSADFPKKGYNVKFSDAEGKKQAQSLLDLPAYEKWSLIAPWSFDLSYINNSVVYALSNQLGRWAPRTRFAEVFFNSDGGEVDSADYAGIYVITDRIEVGAGRVEIASLSASDVAGTAVTGGYILKMDAPDPDDIHWPTKHGLPANSQSATILVAPKAD